MGGDSVGNLVVMFSFGTDFFDHLRDALLSCPDHSTFGHRRFALFQQFYFNNMCAMCYASVASIISVVVYNFLRPGKDVEQFRAWWKGGACVNAQLRRDAHTSFMTSS